MEWEAQEIDRAFDLCNMIFGAALGGYVGVIIASANLQVGQIWWLCGALVPLGLALFAARELAQILRGAHGGSILINMGNLAWGSMLSLMGFSKSGFRVDVIAAIVVSWLLMLTVLLGMHVLRRVWSK